MVRLGLVSKLMSQSVCPDAQTNKHFQQHHSISTFWGNQPMNVSAYVNNDNSLLSDERLWFDSVLMSEHVPFSFFRIQSKPKNDMASLLPFQGLIIISLKNRTKHLSGVVFLSGRVL